MRTSLSVIRRKEETVEGALGTKNSEGRKKRNAAVSGEKWTVSLQFLLTCPHFISTTGIILSKRLYYFFCFVFCFLSNCYAILLIFHFLFNMREVCYFHITLESSLLPNFIKVTIFDRSD